MNIRKVTPEEHIQVETIQSAAFVYPVDVEALKKRIQDEPGTTALSHTWAAITEEGTVTSAIIDWPMAIYYDGHTVGMGGIGGVASSPEYRMQGGIRSIFRKIFEDDLKNGRLFSVLFPFSHAYYRKFGYELCRQGQMLRFPTKSLAPYRMTATARMRRPGDSDAPMRRIYERYAAGYNYAVARDDLAWGNLLRGEPNKNETYQYILSRDGEDVAYGLYRPQRDGDKLGLMLYDFAFTDVDALHQLLGFLYKLSSPYAFVQMEQPDGLDIAALLEEPYDVQVLSPVRTMARVLDVKRALELMRHPQAPGAYSLRVEDAFLPQNTGTYHVAYGWGETMVEKTDAEACDLSVDVQTFAQLCLGYLPLEAARYKKDVALHGNGDILREVFIKKPMFLTDRF